MNLCNGLVVALETKVEREGGETKMRRVPIADARTVLIELSNALEASLAESAKLRKSLRQANARNIRLLKNPMSRESLSARARLRRNAVKALRALADTVEREDLGAYK